MTISRLLSALYFLNMLNTANYVIRTTEFVKEVVGMFPRHSIFHNVKPLSELFLFIEYLASLSLATVANNNKCLSAKTLAGNGFAAKAFNNLHNSFVRVVFQARSALLEWRTKRKIKEGLIFFQRFLYKTLTCDLLISMYARLFLEGQDKIYLFTCIKYNYYAI